MDSQMIAVISLGLALASLTWAIVMQFMREDKAHEVQLVELRKTNALLEMLVAAQAGGPGPAPASIRGASWGIVSPMATSARAAAGTTTPSPPAAARGPFDTEPDEVTKVSAQYEGLPAPPLLYEDGNETVVMHAERAPCPARR